MHRKEGEEGIKKVEAGVRSLSSLCSISSPFDQSALFTVKTHLMKISSGIADVAFAMEARAQSSPLSPIFLSSLCSFSYDLFSSLLLPALFCSL